MWKIEHSKRKTYVRSFQERKACLNEIWYPLFLVQVLEIFRVVCVPTSRGLHDTISSSHTHTKVSPEVHGGRYTKGTREPREHKERHSSLPVRSVREVERQERASVESRPTARGIPRGSG